MAFILPLTALCLLESKRLPFAAEHPAQIQDQKRPVQGPTGNAQRLPAEAAPSPERSPGVVLARPGLWRVGDSAQAGTTEVVNSEFPGGKPQAASLPSRPSLIEAFGQLPLSFEANEGQTDPSARFVARGYGYRLFLTDDGIVLALRNTSVAKSQTSASTGGTSDVLRLKLLGANPQPAVSGIDQLPGKSNYFIGNDSKKWRTNIPTFARVRYASVYPGVDLAYYGNQRQLEYDFVVNPGADPRAIRLAVETGNSEFENPKSKIAVDNHGDLIVRLDGGELRFHKPKVYQPSASKIGSANSPFTIQNPEWLDGGYLLTADNLITFEVRSYDQSRPLVIDPVLSYSTYLGGSGIDIANGIAVASDGTVFVAGGTTSTDFPVVHPLQATNAGGPSDFLQDAFVSKLSADGSTLLYATYLGGSGQDQANAIAIDTFGDAYVTGTTSSANFPATLGSFHANCGCDGECNKTLSTTGLISSDGFVTELNPAGSVIVYSGFISGDGNTQGLGIAVDNNGNAYVTGRTDAVECPSTSPEPGLTMSFPAGAGMINGFQAANAGNADAFVVKIDPTGSSVPYASYLGGSEEDDGFGIAVDNSNDAFVTGLTCSSSFPVSSSLQTYGGNCDAFVTKVDTALTGAGSLIYSTFLGGGAKDQGNGIALDTSGNVYVTGVTNSTNFPTMNPLLPNGGSCKLDAKLVCEGDVFVTELSATPALVFSTYLGGSGADTGTGIAVDSATPPNAYITGFTNSTDFPTGGVPFQTTYGGGNTDAFVAKLNPSASTLVYSSFLGGSNADNGTAIAVDSFGNAYVTGQTCSTNFPIHLPEQAALGGSGNCNAFISKVLVGPDISISPTSLTFPAQGVGTTSTPQTITLTSDGDSSLIIGTITVSGQFTIESDGCSGMTLPPPPGSPSTCNVTVSFTPTSSGPQSGTLTIPDNVAGSPQTVSLSGLVTNVFVLPTALNFGNQLVGATSGALAAMLMNASGSTLTITGIGTSGYFAQDNNCGNSLAAGTSCTISVTFSPPVGATGNQTGTLTITDTDPSSPQTVCLAGHANAPVPSISTSVLNFDTQGATGPAQTVTLSNGGDGALQIDAISISPSFTQTNNCPAASLAAGAFCTFTVSFLPTATGTSTGQLTVTFGNAATPGNDPVQLTGTAVMPVVSLSTPGLAFTGISAGVTTDAQAVVLANSGNAALSIASTILTGVNASEFAIFSNTCPASLAAGGSCAISLTFTPSATGTQLAALSIADNAPGSPQTVGLTGLASAVTVSPTSLTFPSTDVGFTSVALAVTLTNSGTATLLISNVATSGDFAQTNTCGASVVAGASCTISVTFTPTATGNRYGILTVTDSAANSPQTVALAGIGAAAPGVTLAPTSIIFANQPVNTTSSAQSVILTNSGGAALTITSITVTGLNASDFAVSQNTCPLSPSTLAGGAGCAFAMTFTPTAAGVRLASVTVVDNASNSPQSLALSGTGVLLPSVTLSPTSLTFAAEPIGTTSAAQTVTLTNSGGAALTIASITSTPPFGETNTCGASVAAGASCTISVAFTPTASGSASGTVVITDNAPNSPQSVTLLGGAVSAPAVTVSASSLTFPSEPPGATSAAQTVTLSNTGTASLTITSIAVTGPFAETTTTCGATLATSANCTISITFTPTTTGTSTGSLTITDNAPGSPHTVTLGGAGSDFSLASLPASTSIYAGQTAGYKLTITPLFGFNTKIALACSGAPSQASCQMTPATLTLDGTNPATATLSVPTTARVSAWPHGGTRLIPPLGRFVGRLPLGIWLVALMMLTGLLLAGRRRRASLILAFALCCVFPWGACGGGGTLSGVPAGTPAGTYTLTVTASSTPGVLSHNVTVTLTVN